MRIQLARLAALQLVCLFTVGSCSDAPATRASQALQSTISLDSSELAEKRSFDSTVANLRTSSPAMLDSLRALLAFRAHSSLGRLGYIRGPFDAVVTADLRDAIKSYERDRGLPPIGDPLTYELSASLRRDEEILDESVSAPTKIFSRQPNYVLMEGAWSAAELGSQTTAVHISCDRAAMKCTEVQGIVSNFGGRKSLSTDLQEWSIESWDQSEIVTHSVDFPCTRYALKVNLIQESATKIRSTISSSQICAYLSKADLVMRLASGSDFDEKRTKARLPMLLGPAARKLLHQE